MGLLYEQSCRVVKGIDGATKTYNLSDCSSFTSGLLKTAYDFTDQQVIDWTGVSDPLARQYYDAPLIDRGFDGFTDIDDVVAGDLFVVKYYNSNDSGHVMTVVAPPTFEKDNSATERSTL